MQIENKATLLLMVLVMSVWEMSRPAEGTAGEPKITKTTSGLAAIIPSLSTVQILNNNKNLS